MSQITFPTLFTCTPVCTAGTGPQAGGGAGAQATFTPVNCNITVFSICTPVCGAGAAAQGGGWTTTTPAQGAAAQGGGAPWTGITCTTPPAGGGAAAQATF